VPFLPTTLEVSVYQYVLGDVRGLRGDGMQEASGQLKAEQEKFM
jgi:hypothetical protein